MNFVYLVLVLFALGVASWTWRYFRSGSTTGFLLGGKIKREIGQVTISSAVTASHNLKVHAMETLAGEGFVGIAIGSKAPLVSGATPYKLSKAEAKELVELLKQAIAG